MLFVFDTKRYLLVYFGITTYSTLAKLFFILFHIDQSDVNMTGNGMYFSTTTYLDMFLYGGCTAFIMANWAQARLDKALDRTCVIRMVILMFFALSCFQASRTYLYSYFALVACPAFGIISAYFLASSIRNEQPMATRFLRLPVARSLRVLLHGIYMWHACVNIFISNYFLYILFVATSNIQRNILSAFAHLFFIFVSIMLAATSYLFVETPFLKSRRNSFPEKCYKVDAARWIYPHWCFGCCYFYNRKRSFREAKPVARFKARTFCQSFPSDYVYGDASVKIRWIVCVE